MTDIGMTKKTHMDTSQRGKPPGLTVSIAQKAESGISDPSRDTENGKRERERGKQM